MLQATWGIPVGFTIYNFAFWQLHAINYHIIFYKNTWNLLRTLTAFSFLFCLIMLERTLARDCPSLSSRYAGTAPSGVLSSFFCLVFLCSCILMLQVDKFEFVGFSWSLIGHNYVVHLYSRLLHLDLLCVSLFVVQLGLQTD